jgi:hypothetical protein
MAIQTLNTIKNWFKTGLKPTQTQFWDTWDSFRHKNQKVPVTDIEGIDELLSSKTEKSDFKTINGESLVGNGDITFDVGTFTTVTRTEMQNLVGSGNIVAGSTYKILNADNWADVYLTGITPNLLSTQGIGEFKVPKYGNYSYYPWSINMEGSVHEVVGKFQKNEPVVANNGAAGIFIIYGLIKYVSGDWNTATSIVGSYSGATGNVSIFASPNYSTGTVISWGGNHWRNVTGNIGEPLDPLTLNSDWELYTDNMLIEYDLIEYNFERDHIYYRKDKRDNELSTERSLGNKNYNPLKVFRWGDDNVYGNKFTNSYIEICNEKFWRVTNNAGTNWTIKDNIGTSWQIVSNTGMDINISDNIGESYYIQANKLQYCYIQRNYGNTGTLCYNDFNIATISDNISSSGLKIESNSGVSWNIQSNNFEGNYSSSIQSNFGNYWRIEFLNGDYWTVMNNTGNNWRLINNSGREWGVSYNTGNGWSLSNNTGTNWNVSTNSGNLFTLSNQNYSNKSFVFNYINGVHIYMNLSTANVIFQPYTKYFSTKLDGTILVTHYDNSNNLVINNLTD